MVVQIAVEGITDAPIARRLIVHCGLQSGAVYDKNGKSGLDAKLQGYNAAAAHSPWLVVRDLDKEPCAVALAARLLPAPAPRMCFRVAVREMEAWLLADRQAFASYVGIAVRLVPAAPDALEDPKRELVALAGRSRHRSVREDFTPAEGSTAHVGPGYTARVADFAWRMWRPDVAAQSSPSLNRCLLALRRIPR